LTFFSRFLLLLPGTVLFPHSPASRRLTDDFSFAVRRRAFSRGGPVPRVLEEFFGFSLPAQGSLLLELWRNMSALFFPFCCFCFLPPGPGRGPLRLDVSERLGFAFGFFPGVSPFSFRAFLGGRFIFPGQGACFPFFFFLMERFSFCPGSSPPGLFFAVAFFENEHFFSS